MTTPSASTRPFVTLVIAADEARILIIGAGVVGSRKILSLTRQGARVRVVAPEITDSLKPLVDENRIEWLRDRYRSEHLAGARIVVAATSDSSINATVARDARQRGLLVCNASAADDSDILFPAIHQQDVATIAVHTRGARPRFAKRLRDHLAQLLAREPLEKTEAYA